MQIAKTMTALAALVLAQQPALAGAAGPRSTPVAVSFSASLEQRLRDSYGDEERETLRQLVVQSVNRALARSADTAARGILVEVALADARPSHPTRHQALATPSLDPLRSASLGGAELTGTIRAADGRELATLSYRHFAPDLTLASASGDPWADARIAIERFAEQLAERLRPAG